MRSFFLALLACAVSATENFGYGPPPPPPSSSTSSSAAASPLSPYGGSPAPPAPPSPTKSSKGGYEAKYRYRPVATRTSRRSYADHPLNS